MDPEETTAEELFNTLGQQYEDAFADDVELRTVIHSIVAQLPPTSLVLDVGCGTGRPVSDILARHGHSVHGIDVAEEMVRLARSRVPGSFHKVDMRRYRPPHAFGAVFAIFSLFGLPPADLVSMVYRFAEWLEPGASLVLAVVTSDSLDAGVGDYDDVWDCMRVRRAWMGAVTVETLFSRSRWKSLLAQVGFALEMEKTYDYLPRGQKPDQTGQHHLLVARKTGLGPVCDDTAWPILRDRMSIDEGGSDLQDIVRRGWHVLNIGGPVRAILDNGPFSTGVVESIPTLSQTFCFPAQHFDTAVLYFVLDYPNATIVIIQDAPENTCVQLLNSRHVGLSTDHPRSIHQGCLLQTGRDMLAQVGHFSDGVRRINNSFIAADPLTLSWYQDDPNRSRMEEALVGDLRSMSGRESGLGLGNQLAVLSSYQ
ncbi:S-adenosyl-L-methionine-dependent methyltransferase [Aspergillus taichungensis]|uniref:S-adenosyl-L-methionine-dependent methyltransferase n=1 Tax=Aspergillus taichungensis TaxID=482145 RepID=A0A2J5HY31_9EURO|nr:S-adenosyl-L-methionine-dependent methyltransferase [Aspergillus taichungensis]